MSLATRREARAAEGTDVRPLRVLITDDEQDVRWVFSTAMEKEGLLTLEAEDAETALGIMRQELVDVVLLDMRMPGMDGVGFLSEARKINPSTPVIVITGLGSVESAVEAMKNGAYDYLTKPCDSRQLRLVVRRALDARRRTCGGSPAAGIEEVPCSLRDTIGVSAEIAEIVDEVELVAPTDFTVLITGETGTGKEVLARAIHSLSPRAAGPFVPVDCGSIPPTLIESELYGHERGAYTGATQTRRGKFQLASGGTLFLDEVPNLPLAAQRNLLRVLQERAVWCGGGSRAIDVDIRVVAATNQDLNSLVQAKRFRRDLYYRLNEFDITLPPLRDRREDIVFFARRFLEQTSTELSRHVKGFSEDALTALRSYAWPGNIRELRNVVRRAVLQCDTYVEPKDLSIFCGPNRADARGPSTPETGDSRASLKEIVQRNVARVERETIASVLQRTDGNKAEAARILQVDYKTIHKKVKKYHISP